MNVFKKREKKWNEVAIIDFRGVSMTILYNHINKTLNSDYRSSLGLMKHYSFDKLSPAFDRIWPRIV